MPYVVLILALALQPCRADLDRTAIDPNAEKNADPRHDTTAIAVTATTAVAPVFRPRLRPLQEALAEPCQAPWPGSHHEEELVQLGALRAVGRDLGGLIVETN